MQRLVSKIFTSSGTFIAPGGVDKVLVSFYYNNSKLNISSISTAKNGNATIDHDSALNSIDGSAWAWGLNSSGQLGNNLTQFGTSSPISVAGNISFSSIAVGDQFEVGLRGSDGSAWSWGAAANGQLGNNATSPNMSSPVSVAGAISYSKISAGSTHTLAILASNGSAWAWGAGISGQLGNNQTANNVSSPVSVAGPNSYTQIAAGNIFSLGIRGSDSSAWGWGSNGSGQVGNNSTTNISSPVSVVGNISFTQISAGNGTSAGIKVTDGSAWAWGSNLTGQVGNNSTTNISSPVSVVGANSYTKISTGNNATLAIRGSDGSAWAWGSNLNGQIGNNTTTGTSSPVSVAGSISYIAISAGSNYNIGLKSDGSAWTWGAGANGQLGNNTTTGTSSPVSVVGNHSFTTISAGNGTSSGLKADGSVWAWGSNTSGQLGNNTTTGTSSPVSVAGSISYIAISAGSNYNISLKNDGSAWGWGNNTSGQVGDNTATNKSSPVSVMANNYSYSKIAASGHVAAIRGIDGSAWCWGLGTTGQIGNNTVNNSNSPVSVVGANSYTDISAGSGASVGNGVTLAIRGNDGSAWAWGLGTNGQLGNNQIANNTSSPVSVVGSISYIAISAGNAHVAAIRGSDKSGWCWGTGGTGRLGNNSSLTQSSPVSVAGAISYSKISAGYTHSAGIKVSDGSAWCWGNNLNGQVGDGTASNNNSPVSVVGGHSFVDIAAGTLVTHAIKADGSLWSWGAGANGLLGDGTVADKSSPIMIAPVGSIEGSEKECASTVLVSVTPGTSYTVSFTGNDCIMFNNTSGFGQSISISWAD